MTDMTRTERACANVAIEQIMRDWNHLHDGDNVAMMQQINAILALSLATQRVNKQPVTVE